MYQNLTPCVLTKDGLTECFSATIGTRQGCMLSPFLFNIYLNELIEECKNKGCEGVYINEEFPNVMMLLFADDATQGADTVGRLQKLLDTLADYSHKWGLSINAEKSKIVVFRNGGYLRQNEKWYLNGKRLEVVSYLKYLGLMFSSRLVWSVA